MKKEVLSQFSMPWLTSLACVLFVVVFVGMLLWTFRKGSTKLYEECGHIPLEDGAEKRGNS